MRNAHRVLLAGVLLALLAGMLLILPARAQANPGQIGENLLPRQSGTVQCYYDTRSTFWLGDDPFGDIPTTVEVTPGTSSDEMLVRVATDVRETPTVIKQGIAEAGRTRQGKFPDTVQLLATSAGSMQGSPERNFQGDIVTYAGLSNPGKGAFVTLWRVKWQQGVGDKNVYVSIQTYAGVDRVAIQCPLSQGLREPAYFEMKASAANMPESPGRFELEITRSGNLAERVELRLALSGTATATQDFTPSGLDASAPNAVVFESGETRKVFTVFILPDEVSEGNETVVFSLTQAQGGVVRLSPQVSVIIVDDEKPEPLPLPSPEPSPGPEPSSVPSPQPGNGPQPCGGKCNERPHRLALPQATR